MCAPAGPRRFESGHHLIALPYFKKGDGGLCLADGLGPVIDAHTHLALSYIRRETVDLRAAPRPTEHYLPEDAPVDLDVYANKNFTAAHLRALKIDLGPRSLIDGGMRATHTAPNLVSEMARLNVARSVLLPIDFPILSHNAESYLTIAGEYGGLVSMGSVHPHQSRVFDRLQQQKAAGAKGIKVHPAVQMIPADHPKAMVLYRFCGELGLPIMWHCGPVGIESKRARQRCQLKHYWRAIHDNPQTTFILGHSGALQMELGLELAKTYPNVYLELASQSVSNVRRIVLEAPRERVIFGSDWPFYSQAMAIAKVLLATEDRAEQRSMILFENAARLFSISKEALRRAA